MSEEWIVLRQLPEFLLCWYQDHRRELPWRKNISAYRTWISEIMLQQTRVGTVIPYFERFMSAFPTIEALALSDDEQLLSLWQGLGYYSRAKNLKKAAQIIYSDFHGEMPSSYEDVISLPGIGDYTAGAILSIAYGLPIPAVDGNVLRVMARILNYHENVLDEKNKKQIRGWMQSIMPKDRSGDFNQALMDLGSMVCLPNSEPLCSECPARIICQAYKNHTVTELPVRTKKDKKKTEKYTVFILSQNECIAVEKRSSAGLLADMWQFPNVEGNLNEADAAACLKKWNIVPQQWHKKRQGTHIFSHIRWELTIYDLSVTGCGKEEWEWCSQSELEIKAMPTAFRKFYEGEK